MNTIHPTSITFDTDTLKSTLENDTLQQFLNIILFSEKDSHEKYMLQNQLIKNAPDMSTQEKLIALDKNYTYHNHEHWKNVAYSVALLYVLAIPLIAAKKQN